MEQPLIYLFCLLFTTQSIIFILDITIQPTHNKNAQQNEDDFNWLIWYITTRKVVQEIRDCGSKPHKTMEKIKFFDEKKVDENID